MDGKTAKTLYADVLIGMVRGWEGVSDALLQGNFKTGATTQALRKDVPGPNPWPVNRDTDIASVSAAGEA